MDARLTLVCHGATRATRKSAFPADEPLDERAANDLAASTPPRWRADAVLSSPVRAALDTAAALGLVASVDLELRDIDVGRWAARRVSDVGTEEPAELGRWLVDPAYDGHGGESLESLRARSALWVQARASVRGHTLAVTHPSLVRAMLVGVLGAPPEAFWRIDVMPSSVTELRHDGRRWALRSCGVPLLRG